MKNIDGYNTLQTNKLTEQLFGLNVDKMFVPKSAKLYYKYVEYFFTYTIIGQAIMKVARFPIANVTVKSKYNLATSETEGKKIIRQIKLKEKLILAGRDKKLYGIAFVVPMYPIRKTITCKYCDKTYSLRDLEKKGVRQYEYRNGKFFYKCKNKKCSHYNTLTAFKSKDEPIYDVKKLNLVIWSPNNMDVNYNRITGEKEWIYELDQKTKKLIELQDHFTLSTTPDLYLKAAQKNNRIKINSSRIFIFESPTLQIDGLPIPPMVMAFNDLYLRTKFNKANRTIASDLLLPLRMLFPIHKEETGRRPLAKTTNMQDWRRAVNRELEAWRKDHNHVPVMPIEIGTKDVWGQGKLLVLNNDLKSNMADILACFDIPVEFIYGGSTWSRQNVSSIVLENAFRAETAADQDLLDYIAEQINNQKLTNDAIELKLEVPRLVEQMAESTLLERGVERGEISTDTYYNRFGINARKERARIESAKADLISRAQSQAELQALAQAEGDKILVEAEKNRRNFERIEGLKDSIAMASIESDKMDQHIKTQKQLMEINKFIQQGLMNAQSKLNKTQMKEQVNAQIEGLKKQLKIQSKQQISDSEKMQKIQREQILNSMSPEEQNQFKQLSPEQQSQVIQNKLQETDPAISKETRKEDIETQKEEKALLAQAEVYNKLQGKEKEYFKQELIGESTERFAIVQQYADAMIIQEFTEKLMSAAPDEVEGLWGELKSKYPDLVDDAYQNIEKQLFMREQASSYAVRLFQLSGSKEQQELISQLNNFAPDEFKQLVIQNYQQYLEMSAEQRQHVNQQKKKPIKQSDMKNIAMEIATNISNRTPEEKKELLKILKFENPELYKNVVTQMEI